MRWISRLIKAAAAALVLLVLVVGPPWALVRFIGNPWPAEGVSLSAPFTDGAIIGLLAAVVWVLWAQLMVCVVVEAIAALSADRIQLRAPLTLGVQQQLARRLVTAIVLATVATPVVIGGAATAAPAPGGYAPADHGVRTDLTSQVVASDRENDRSGAHRGADHRGAAVDDRGDRQDRDRLPAADRGGNVRDETATVMRLDTLMDIAERTLDDPHRWEEIAALNEGRTMNDGTVFRTDGYLQPGWKLLVPNDATATGADDGIVVVKPNQTLSGIALTELDDATRYPEIVAASTNIVQPNGDRLVDPDHIEPGWVLHLPDDRPGSESDDKPRGERGDGHHGDGQEIPPAEDPGAGQPDDTPEEEPPAPEESAPAPDTSAGTATDAGTDVDDDHDQVVDEDEAAWPVRTIGGICVLLAGALVGLIALRRSRQRRQRRPGQQLPLPGVEAEQVEREVRAVADDIGVAVVDVALRGLAAHCDQTGQPRPQLVATRMTGGQLDVYLAGATDLPAPWTATEDPTVWVLPAGHAAELEETAAAVSAPYPALVSVGHDAEEGVIMLNLAHLGSLSLAGAPGVTEEAMTALALELGTAPWAEDLALTVIGSMAELGDALEPGRVRYVPTPGGVRPAVYGKTHVVLATESLDATQRRKLRGLGAALITRDEAAEQASEVADGWRVDLVDRDHATVQPLGLELRPQLVDRRTYHGLLEVLAASQAAPDRPDAQQHAQQHGGPGPIDHVVPFDPAPPALEDPPAAATVDVDQGDEGDVDEASGEPAEAIGPVAPAQTQEDQEHVPFAAAEPAEEGAAAGEAQSEFADVDRADVEATPAYQDPSSPEPASSVETAGVEAEHGEFPTTHPVTAAVTDTPEEPAALVDEPALLASVPEVHPLLQTGHPVIRLLAPVVDIIGATAAAPTSETHQKVCTRLATFLALNPDTSRPALTDAVWGGQRISRGTVDSRISNLRRWLGSNPVTDEAYLPPRALQFTESVTTDWHVFAGLVGNDPTTAPTAALEEALTLVRGRPLEGEESKHYGFAEYALEGIVTRLVDTAYELARRRYMDGKWAKAAQAAALGVLLDPGNEHLWRLRIHAAHSSGNPHQVAEAIDRMHARISELGFDLEPETTALLHALDQHDANTIEQSREAL